MFKKFTESFKTDKDILTHPMFIGDLITTIVKNATNSLLVAFILMRGIGMYQLQIFLCTAAAVIFSLCMQRWTSLRTLAYKKFKLFMIIETVIRIAVGIISVITKDSLIYIIVSIAITPIGQMQSLANIEIMSRTSDMKKFTEISSIYSPYISVAGYAAGFIVNGLMSAPMAFFILCMVEVVNNIFYYVAYKKIPKVTVTTTTEEVKEEDRAG